MVAHGDVMTLCHDIFLPFFHNSNASGPVIHMLKYFRILSRICGLAGTNLTVFSNVLVLFFKKKKPSEIHFNKHYLRTPPRSPSDGPRGVKSPDQ